ncbi:MAG: LamG domain-containing protein, partial [Candidatus Aenigmatarchaeota archaeon]
NDGTQDGDTVESNIVTVQAVPVPTIDSVLLNATTPYNYTIDNLTAYPQNPQDYVTLIYNWKVNDTSIAVLNMPFDTNVSVNDTNAVRDYSGFGNNGTLGGGDPTAQPTWTSSGASGGAYDFDGADDYIEAQNTDLEILTHEISVEIWIKADNATERTGVIEMRPAETSEGWTIQVDNKRVFVNYHNETNWASYYGLGQNSVDQPITEGEWHQIVWTYSQSKNNATLYVDAALKDYDIVTEGSIYYIADELQIGRGWYAGEINFNGSIDHVQVYNKALSEDEIKALAGKAVIIQPQKTATITHSCNGLCKYRLILTGLSRTVNVMC